MSFCQLSHVSTNLAKGSNLQNISFSMEKDHTVVVLGNNGSGKSEFGTLLRGKLPIKSGTITLPKVVEVISFERIQAIIDEDNIEADITEATLLNPGITCGELILREGESATLPRDLLVQFSLENKVDLAIRHLSTGEMQKALIIAATLKKPDLLILDEPYDGLDVESRTTLRTLIDTHFVGEIGLVLLLNRMDEIPQQTTSLLFLESGTIALQGDSTTLLSSREFQKLITLNHSLPKVLPGEHRVHSPKINSNGALISLKDVTIAYGNSTVLNKVNLEVHPGEHYQISGPNGCGKSTLLSLISGDHPQSFVNDITLFGYRRGGGETLWDIKRELGIVSTLLHRDYKVGGTVLSVLLSGFTDSIGLYTKPLPLQKTEALLWLEVLGMSDMVKKSFRSLSYGEQRMVLIARAMVKRPTLLILDEPALGLDSINRQLLLQLVNTIATTSQTTILYVTHHHEDIIGAIQKRIEFVTAKGGGYSLKFV